MATNDGAYTASTAPKGITNILYTISTSHSPSMFLAMPATIKQELSYLKMYFGLVPIRIERVEGEEEETNLVGGKGGCSPFWP